MINEEIAVTIILIVYVSQNMCFVGRLSSTVCNYLKNATLDKIIFNNVCFEAYGNHIVTLYI